MGFLPEAWIDEVVSRTDIVEVVSEHIAIKPSGKGYFGLCPFHNEKTPSFHVSPEKQVYHCFGCGEGGNVLSFVMEMERLEFPDAVKLLAERAGMPIPETTDSRESVINTRDIKDTIYEMNRECARYYHRILMAQEGNKALEYLEARGLDQRTIKTFGLGFVPDGWDNVLTFLTDKGYTRKQMLDAGIVVENKEKHRVYDRFRNRIIFPIIHPRGMVLGFGGRVMDDSLPKYLNSSDSPVFNKSNTLFGLNLVKKLRPLENIIIVEGYMDVITLHQYGFGQAVASLGTSLTQDQARMLRRYAMDVYIAYDGDAAGQSAALRGLDILYDAGCRVKVLKFPKGMDPDDVLKTYGPEYFKKLMDQSLSLVDYKLDRLKEQYDLTTQEGRVSMGTEAAKILVKVDNLIERDANIQRLESLIGIKPRIIYDQILRLEGNNRASGLKTNTIGNNRYTRDNKNHNILIPSNIRAERLLIALMAQNGSIAQRIVQRLEDADFEDEFHRHILSIVKDMVEKGMEVTGANIISHLDDKDAIRKLVAIFNQEMEYDNIDNFISDCLDRVAGSQLRRKRQDIQSEISQMDHSGITDPDRYRSLLQELELLNRRVSVVDRKGGN